MILVVRRRVCTLSIQILRMVRRLRDDAEPVISVRALLRSSEARIRATPVASLGEP